MSTSRGISSGSDSIQGESLSLASLRDQLAPTAAFQKDVWLWDPEACRHTANAYDKFLRQASATLEATPLSEEQLDLLSAENVIHAFKILLKCQYDPDTLSTRVREWEKSLGKIKQTPLTDHLSLRLLTANGKAGNVGRTLSLLQLRKARGYRPRNREFVYAITSLHAANWKQRSSRNIFIADADQPAVDNPTRWLDAILLNMSERQYPLTTNMANRMLDCYSAGRTGKAAHHFYRVVREGVPPTPENESPVIQNTQEMPHDWFYFPMTGYKYQPIRVKVRYNREMPPFFKVPAQVRGKLLYQPDSERGVLKLDLENEPEYSIPLAAAFAFAESLQHGACGHDPIQLNRGSYIGLIKACVHRGALWRAMHVLDTTMPAADIKPNAVCYNLILSGLAVVGDVVMAQEYYTKMFNAGIKPDAYTVRAIVDGLLNVGDVQGAITVVQDFFNQHSVLPHYTTHTKILELCLGQNLIYEAKRYVYFIQQLWRWEPNQYHDEKFIKLMRATQRNTQLQKPALKKLFAYFGEELSEADFLS
jgi:pentatricopeptide repeat protein